MRLALDAVLFLAALGILARAVQEASAAHRGTGRPPARGGGKRGSAGRPPGQQSAAARKGGLVSHWLETSRIKLQHRLGTEREEQKHAHRRAEQEQRAELERERDREWRQAGGEGPRPRGVRSVIRVKPEKPDGGEPPEPPRAAPAPEPPPAGGPATPPPGAPAPAPAREPARTPQPAPQSPPAPAPQPANGGTTPVTTPAPSSSLIATGVQDVITAVDRLAAMATQGDIHHKRAAHAAFCALFTRTGTALQTLSRTMQDGQHYGPEMTEPSATAAMHVTAAASVMASGESAIKAFLNLKVEELKNSGRQVPHHGQLEGNPA